MGDMDKLELQLLSRLKLLTNRFPLSYYSDDAIVE